MPVTPRSPEIISEGTTMNNFDSAGNGLRGVLNRHENDITDLQADYTVKTAEISTLESQDETGWIAAGETWTYASATTFTVASDVTGKYQAGDKIKLTQTTAKYFYITNVSYSDPNTTITVDGQSTYTLANAAITSPYFSKILSPQGFNLSSQIYQVPASAITTIPTTRQDDTTNASKSSVIRAGWGVLDGGGVSNPTESVSFGVTFASIPIVVATYGGDHASLTTYGAGGPAIKRATVTATSITTTGFSIRAWVLDGTTWSAGQKVFYQWIAIGELS